MKLWGIVYIQGPQYAQDGSRVATRIRKWDEDKRVREVLGKILTPLGFREADIGNLYSQTEAGHPVEDNPSHRDPL